MKFLVDAQLPRKFCGWLNKAGHDSRHTLDLPEGNRTQDREIIALADAEACVVVTKDDDFVQSFLLSGRPARLLLVSVGNMSNSELEALIHGHITGIETAFDYAKYVELARDSLIVHE